jgi:undecaprenyl diphosphate synthase
MVAMNAVADTSALRHVIVVGGTVADWAAMSAEQWSERLGDLGKVADTVGASWLTIRPYAGDGADGVLERTVTVGDCRVCAHPEADGRGRVAAAATALQAEGRPVTEDAIAERLNAPAEADPDLVVVLGSSHRLPPSLVWELAYSELVFLDVAWADLTPEHLDQAISSYARRNRRFGGVND